MRSLLPTLLALLSLGCSYSFKGQVAGDIRSISIPTFENETPEFGLAEALTDELIRGFQRDGTLRVTGEDAADAVLVGRVMRVDDQPYSARPGETILVEEYRFSMTCEIDLVDPETREPIWTQVFPAWAVYEYTGSLENREAAIEEATGKLMEDILNKIVGGW